MIDYISNLIPPLQALNSGYPKASFLTVSIAAYKILNKIT